MFVLPPPPAGLGRGAPCAQGPDTSIPRPQNESKTLGRSVYWQHEAGEEGGEQGCGSPGWGRAGTDVGAAGGPNTEKLSDRTAIRRRAGPPPGSGGSGGEGRTHPPLAPHTRSP